MKEYRLTVAFKIGIRCCYYGKTKKEAIAAFERNYGTIRSKQIVKREWELIDC